MKTIEVRRRPIVFADYVKRSAMEADCKQIISEPTILTENGRVVVVYAKMTSKPAEIINALIRVKYSTGKRSTGLLSTSRIIGYRPRLVRHGKDYCSSTSLAYDQPQEHASIVKYSNEITELYQKYAPDTFAKHATLVKEKIKPDYHIEKSPFTSGIINKNNPLKYHFDTGNFKDVFSCMLVFKNGIRGGRLALPEFDVKFDFQSNSLFMFDGQGILHGVTPIVKLTPRAFRYSIVFYTLQQMWKCLTVTEEIARTRTIKMGRENRRLGPPDPSLLKRYKK